VASQNLVSVTEPEVYRCAAVEAAVGHYQNSGSSNFAGTGQAVMTLNRPHPYMVPRAVLQRGFLALGTGLPQKTATDHSSVARSAPEVAGGSQHLRECWRQTTRPLLAISSTERWNPAVAPFCASLTSSLCSWYSCREDMSWTRHCSRCCSAPERQSHRTYGLPHLQGCS